MRNSDSYNPATWSASRPAAQASTGLSSPNQRQGPASGVGTEHRYAFEQILRSDRVGVWLVVFTALLMLLPRILAGVQDCLIHDHLSGAR